jgi:ACS family hexuronate transporter-like MFS transporter
MKLGRPEVRNAADDSALQAKLLQPAVSMPDSQRALARHRWIMLSILLLVTVINFIDRQTLSILAPVLRAALHLTNQQYGRIVSLFQFGMLTGEFPMGYIMDRWGARLGLSFAVLWWSGATGAQVFARNGFDFGLSRFWMGTGECGNYSGGVKTLTRLFSRKDRTLALGIFNSGSIVGLTVAVPIIVFLFQHYGFHVSFLLPSLAGVVWVPLWWFAYGKEHKEQEVTCNARVSLPKMLYSPESWAIMAMRFFIGPVMQFYWYWIPSYLVEVRHMSMSEPGWLGWIPFLLGSVGGVAGGWTAGLLHRAGVSTVNVRRILMYTSSVLCMASMLVPLQQLAAVAVLLIGVAIFADNFVSANMFGVVTDLFPEEQVGRATGLTGVAGGLSGLLFPLLTGWVVDHGSYSPVFIMVGVMPLMGTIAVFLISQRYRNWNRQLSSLTA